MIQLTAIGPQGEAVACPHCRRALLTAFLHEQKATLEGDYLYGDGDTVPIYEALTEEQRRPPLDWHAALLVGECSFCFGPYFCINAALIDTEADDEFRDVYLYRNGDRGEETNFVARRGEDTWIVSRFETNLGPLLEHQFGPFADTYGDWIGPGGVAACAQGGPWEFAVEFLRTRWDELRALKHLFGPSRPYLRPPKRSNATRSFNPDDIPF